jgi:hypothetical protein
VLRGGAGLFYDKLTLNATSFDQLPARTVTRYLADGVSLAGPANIQRLVVDGGRLRNPESVAWSLELDRKISAHLALRVGYQQRERSRELVVEPPAPGAGAALLRLANSGRSRYRELEFTGRYVTGPSQLVVSYVRSSAIGDLNTLNTFLADVEDPLIRGGQRSPLPFDAPNRLLAWGEFELPGGWGVAPLLEVRDGFPRSIVDENLDFVGGRNRAGRFPRFFSLDAQVWKAVTLPWPAKIRARIGAKVFNLTNHFNPRDFDGNLGSSGFGGYSNGVSRTFRGKFVFDF